MYSYSLVLSTFFVVSVLSDVHNLQTGMERILLNASSSDHIWSVRGVSETEGEIRVPVTVPGGIYTDLEENGISNSPIYHEYNDLETKWVGRTNWTYTRKFEVSQSILEKEKVVLVCEGLDTVANVLVNGITVGRSENMFVRYIYDIKSALKLGTNYLKIEFESPVEYAQNEYKKHEEMFGYAVRPESLVSAFRGEDKVQFIRKMQSSFSWDWGPSYPSSGIWKDIFIEAYNDAVIRDVIVYMTPSKFPPDESSDTQWAVAATVYYDSARNCPAQLSFSRVGQESKGKDEVVELEAGTGKQIHISLTESGENTKLWWPNGYGAQNLYSYTVSLNVKNLASTKNIRIGFRTVELMEELVNPSNPDHGREFYFQVNGVKIYSKGSNSIPIHVLPERITEKHTEWILRAAKLSHQNMIRVWGGGMYESDFFYNMADEYGIMIWQDFMFACALYPASPDFLENVKQEVDTQVKRLQHHPSLVLWAGNNENEGGLQGGWFGFEENYFSDYRKLYIDTIKKLVNEMDLARGFLPSSPTNGRKTEEENWIAENPGDLTYGDIHAYDYYSDNWNWRIYKRARYSSEYGYQSYPHYETLAEVADNISQWSWSSPSLEHRQHHPNGQYELENMIETHLPVPKDKDSPAALPDMLYLVQLTQVMGQKIQTESYRRLQDKLRPEDGTGHNMGALYWQLNDIWQGCSWSSIEVKGRWKLQMYYARNFFAPVLASPFQLQNGDVSIELISDSREKFEGTLTAQVFRLDSKNTAPIYEQWKNVTAEFLTSKQVFLLEKSTLESLNCNENFAPCIVYTTLPGTPDNFLFLQYPKDRNFIPDPQLKVISVAEARDGNTIRFTLTSQTVASFVFLTMKNVHYGYFSDNGFVQVTPRKEMTFYAEDGITMAEFQEGLQVMSLYDVAKNAKDIHEKPIQNVPELVLEDESYSDSNELSIDIEFYK